jgi:hypothetical protein
MAKGRGFRPCPLCLSAATRLTAMIFSVQLTGELAFLWVGFGTVPAQRLPLLGFQAARLPCL